MWLYDFKILYLNRGEYREPARVAIKFQKSKFAHFLVDTDRLTIIEHSYDIFLHNYLKRIDRPVNNILLRNHCIPFVILHPNRILLSFRAGKNNFNHNF